MKQVLDRLVFLIPAYNEERNILPLLQEMVSLWPDVPLCVIDDHSSDTTRRVLRVKGCDHLHLPCNLGEVSDQVANLRLLFLRPIRHVPVVIALIIEGDGRLGVGQLGRVLLHALILSVAGLLSRLLTIMGYGQLAMARGIVLTTATGRVESQFSLHPTYSV